MKQLTLIFILTLGINLSYSESSNKEVFLYEKVISNKLKKVTINVYKTKFNETVEFIKKHEGFRSKPYQDINGYWTIGYGQLTKYLPSNFRHNITKKQSDSMIRVKLNKNLKIVNKKYPNLNKYQSLMVSHLIYCKGLGNIQKHPINNQIKKGYINKNTLIYFSKYEVERPHYRKTRQFEWSLWNYKI